MPNEKRVKRVRGRSPSSSSKASSPAPGVMPTGRIGVSITIPFQRDAKARRDALASELPLQTGRKVAFRPSPAHKGNAESDGQPDEGQWMLAIITECINQDKNRLVFP
jgi:SAGA-associated factor 29